MLNLIELYSKEDNITDRLNYIKFNLLAHLNNNYKIKHVKRINFFLSEGVISNIKIDLGNSSICNIHIEYLRSSDDIFYIVVDNLIKALITYFKSLDLDVELLCVIRSKLLKHQVEKYNIKKRVYCKKRRMYFGVVAEFMFEDYVQFSIELKNKTQSQYFPFFEGRVNLILYELLFDSLFIKENNFYVTDKFSEIYFIFQIDKLKICKFLKPKIHTINQLENFLVSFNMKIDKEVSLKYVAEYYNV